MARNETGPPADPAPSSGEAGATGTAGATGAGRLARLARLGRPAKAPGPPPAGKPPRSAAPAYWFPLALFGLLSLAAAPFYRVAGQYSAFGWAGYAPLQSAGNGGFFVISGSPFLPGGLFRHSFFLPGGPWFFDSSFVLGWYWLEAIVGGYLLTLAWYRRQARRTGAVLPARSYWVAGIVLIAAGLVLPLLWVTLSGFWQPTLLAALWMQGTVEFIVIAMGLWLFASHERSRSLVVIALAYTVTALLTNVWQPAALLPIVLLPGAVLFVAGLGVLALRRRPRPA